MTSPALLVSETEEDPNAWRELAACFDTDSTAFIPTSIALEETRMAVDYQTALRICSECLVQQDCLDFALRTHQVFGVWGGKTPQQRIAMRKRRGRQASPSS